MEQTINRLLDEIKKLYEERIEAERNNKKEDRYQSENITDLVSALSKAQGSYPAIGADRENPYFKSNYADLNMIMKAVRPALATNGLSLTQDTRFTEDGSTILHTRLYHSTGQWIETRARILPTKNTPQDYGSCLSYNKRYSAMALLCVTIDKDPSDDDAEVAMTEAREIVAKGTNTKYKPKDESHETVTREQIEELEYELVGAPDLAEMVLDKLQIQSLADMPKSKYMVSLQRIREIKAKRSSAR
jgi:hypothetical protein